MAMGYPPFTALAAVHLGGSQGVGTRLTVDGRRGVLEASRVGHVAHHVVRQQLERIRRAVGEGLPERGESSSSSACPWALRHAPSTLTGSLRDQMARRGAGSPLCRASSASYSAVSTQARKSSRSVMRQGCAPVRISLETVVSSWCPTPRSTPATVFSRSH